MDSPDDRSLWSPNSLPLYHGLCSPNAIQIRENLDHFEVGMPCARPFRGSRNPYTYPGSPVFYGFHGDNSKGDCADITI